MGKILNFFLSSDSYSAAKFSIELNKSDLAGLDKIIINFCSLIDKNGKTWVNMPSLKERNGPTEGKYKPVVELFGDALGPTMEKVKEAVKQARNIASGQEKSIFDSRDKI